MRQGCATRLRRARRRALARSRSSRPGSKAKPVCPRSASDSGRQHPTSGRVNPTTRSGRGRTFSRVGSGTRIAVARAMRVSWSRDRRALRVFGVGVARSLVAGTLAEMVRSDANGGTAGTLPTGGSSGASTGGTAGAAAGGTFGTGAGNAGAGGTGAAGSAGTSGAAGTGTRGSDGGPPIYPPCDGSTVHPANARLTALGANQAIDLGRFTCKDPRPTTTTARRSPTTAARFTTANTTGC